jgi:hypothetical protein
VRELLAGGKPQNQSNVLKQAGVPEAESDVSRDDLQNLSDTVTQVTASQRNATNGSAAPTGRVV